MANRNFSHIEHVFVDSLEALKIIENQGLNSTASIVSASPAVLMSKNILNKYQVEIPQPTKFERMPFSTHLFVKKIRSELKDYCSTDALTGLITQYTWSFASVVEKALYLKSKHFTSPVLVITVGRSGEKKYSKINFPWQNLLKSNDQLVVTNVEDISIAEQPISGSDKVPLIDRLWLQGYEQYGFKIIQKLHAIAPFLGPRGKILYTRELPLLKSAGYYLAKRFFCLEKISPPQIKISKQFNLSEQATVIAKSVNLAYGEIVPPAVIATLTQNFCAGLERWLSEFTALVPLWEEVLINSLQKKRGAILSGLRIAPETAALFAAAEKVSIPIYSFQHGPAKELNELNRHSSGYYEGNLSHYFFAWSKISASINQSQLFNIAHCTHVGLPKTYKKKALRSPIKNQPKILYASSLLLKGSSGLSALSSVSDYHAMETEKLIIEKVLSQTDNSVLYKKYPHDLRYSDVDPFDCLISKSKNIRIYQGPLELRYFLPFSDLILTSGASSTLAWCIVFDNPLIYLENKYFRPLASEVREILSKCIFYFDLSDPVQIRKLSSLINQPLEKTQMRWNALKKLRDDFRKNYLGFIGNTEGQKCAKIIETKITKKN